MLKDVLEMTGTYPLGGPGYTELERTTIPLGSIVSARFFAEAGGTTQEFVGCSPRYPTRTPTTKPKMRRSRGTTSFGQGAGV